MVADPAYDSWEKVWVFREPEKYSFLATNKITKVVSYGKGAYYKAYAQAKYWITNSRLPKELQPTKEQVYIQCWHGTPLKKLGFDLEHYAEKNSSLQEVRNNYLDEGKRVTHMPSPSPFYTEKITSAFHLKELGKESVLQEMGYPRNDALFTTSTEEIRRIKDRLGIPADKKIILYAPTWRETEHIPGEGYQYDLKVDFDKWKERLGERYVVLFRAHYFISNAFDFSSYEGFVYNVSDVDDINQLYLVSDLLITDYSSAFFDYANLERPIVFYMYVFGQEVLDLPLYVSKYWSISFALAAASSTNSRPSVITFRGADAKLTASREIIFAEESATIFIVLISILPFLGQTNCITARFAGIPTVLFVTPPGCRITHSTGWREEKMACRSGLRSNSID